MLRGKNILLISPEPWDHIFVSKHHYATNLAQIGNRVFFLNPPSNQVLIEATDFKNVFSIHYKGFIKGMRFMPKLLQRFLIRQKFNELQRLYDITFDIVWSFDNSVFFDFSALPKCVFKISHIVDLNQDFQFDTASKTANICLSTTRYILEKQLKHNVNSHNIGHGVNVQKSSNRTFNLKGNNKYKCGYTGNLDIAYIDWQLVRDLVRSFPDVDFHFVGKWTHKNDLIENSNFHYYGQLEANELACFYQTVDILLIVYLNQLFPEQLANPHKMMEYLSSGKMVVATRTEEHELLHESQLILMARLKDEFLGYFKNAVSNMPVWNSTEKQGQRTQFALQNTYIKKIKNIEKWIKSHNS